MHNQERERYKRQLLVNDFGLRKQELLKKKKVLLVGLGGLGGVIAQYLVRAGVGELRLMDGDVVELSNLQRQLLYDKTDLGKPKALVAKTKLSIVNECVKLISFPEEFSESNSAIVSRGVDLIIDGSDNLRTRFLMNNECLKKRIPFIHSAVEETRGVCGVFMPKGACYSCVYKNPNHERIKGILGPAAGVAGSLSAFNAISLLTELIKPKESFMTIFTLLNQKFDTIKLKRDVNCKACK